MRSFTSRYTTSAPQPIIRSALVCALIPILSSQNDYLLFAAFAPILVALPSMIVDHEPPDDISTLNV
jgi:hypothetical protein